MPSIPLCFILIISINTILAIESPEESSSSSSALSTTTLPSSSLPTHSPKVIASSARPWPVVSAQQQPSGPINYYQFAHSPPYNYRSPLPSSSSFSSLMSNLFSPFNKVISRRAAGGKLFSLADQFNTNNNNGANNIGIEYSGSVGSLDALNEAVNNVMMGLNGLQPNQANQLAGQLGSYLSMTGMTDASAKNGKKLLDIPKQWYKLLGEKLSGAGEAAYTATVPLKESFMHTLKSFYSYIKPSRSQSASPFADATSMVAAAAAAAAQQDSLASLTGSNSLQANNNNPKRRQSDSYGGYYAYNYVNSKQTQPQQQPQSSVSSSMVSNGARFNSGRYHHQHQQPQHHNGYVTGKYQPLPSSTAAMAAAVPVQHQPRSTSSSSSSKMNQMQTQSQAEMLPLESQMHASNPTYYQPLAKQPTTNEHVIATSVATSSQSQYDQMLNQMINAQIQQGQQQMKMMSAQIQPQPQPQPQKHPNALYQKSKELISRFTKKRVPNQAQYGFNTLPIIPEYIQTPQRLPTQTVAKVSHKLPTLPLMYNAHNQPKASQQQQQSKVKNQHSYYTQQPINQNGLGIQPVYPPPQQQSSLGTTSISSTPSPMSTSTSVSMSIHQQSSYQGMENLEPQNIHYHHQQTSTNNDHIKTTYDDNSNGNISVQNNQGSVVYYYENPQAIRQSQQPQQEDGQEQTSSVVSSSSSSSPDNTESESQKKKK